MLRRLVWLLFVLILSFGSPLEAFNIPDKPDGYVSDYAQVLSPPIRQRLEEALGEYERHSTNQIAVMTLGSIGADSIEEFSMRVAEKWKVGQKDRANGVILFVFVKERKIRIEVGYGLEGALPDILAGRIIQERMAPFFKEGDFGHGILAGVEGIMEVTQREFPPEARYTPGGHLMSASDIRKFDQVQARMVLAFIGIAAGFIFFIDLVRYAGYSKSHDAYAGRYDFWEWFFRFAILTFVVSMIFRLMFYSMLFSRGRYYGGRGGFSGFRGGGGSFGGGGATGGW